MRKWIPASLIAAAWAISLAAFERLPDRIPTHWGMTGEVDGWSGRTVGAFGFPTLMLVMWGILYWLPSIDPRRDNYAKFRGSYDAVVAAVLGLMLIVHGAVIAVSLGWDVPIPVVISLSVGALLIVVGNLLPRARPNWFFGIRTPWTLSSDRVWDRTHRVGGRVMVVAGLIVAVSGLAPAPWPVILVTVAAIGGAVVPIVYSYVAWREDRRG